MSRDIDTRARQAATGLKEALDAAEFSSKSPAIAKHSKPLVAVLRPAMIMALLLVGSAVGVALVRDSSPAATTIPLVPTTTAIVPTTLAGVVPVDPEPAAPAVAVVPPAPTTTVFVDAEPPLLEVTSPEDGAELGTKTVTFEGITESGASVFSGKWEAEVEASGEWHIVLILSEGSNVARFTASDTAGNESEASITVHYVPEEKTTTTTIEKELAKFTASATFGTCAETPPYDIYYGTGEPGSLVSISSEYGSGSVEVGEEGIWEKKVTFETAPPNTPFVVTVSDDFGRSKQFEFIHEPA